MKSDPAGEFGQGLEGSRLPRTLHQSIAMTDPLYREACFRSPVPLSDLPTTFGIVTACNPFGQLISPQGEPGAHPPTTGAPHLPRFAELPRDRRRSRGPPPRTRIRHHRPGPGIRPAPGCRIRAGCRLLDLRRNTGTCSLQPRQNRSPWQPGSAMADLGRHLANLNDYQPNTRQERPPPPARH